jgi:hypothetical protein
MLYSKLFSSLVYSSLWSEPDHIRILFITMLALADRDGYVYGSRNGLMRAALIDMDAADEHDPFQSLMTPDKDSSDLLRNPDNEGKRIEEIPGGFKIINYTYYRGLRDAEDRKVQNREAQRRHREKGKSATVSHGKPIESKIQSKSKSEIETEMEIETESKTETESKNIDNKNSFSTVTVSTPVGVRKTALAESDEGDPF